MARTHLRKAVIIAGGRGERLHPLTRDIPKPMVPIAGKPLLEYQIDALKRNGIEEVSILSGYKGNVIEDYFGDGRKHGVCIRHFRESKPMGTAGCFKALEKEVDEDFLVVYGDIMFDLNINDLFGFYKEKDASAVLALHPNDHPYDSDIVVTDHESKIIDFMPKGKRAKSCPNSINAGLYILSSQVFKYVTGDEASDFIKDVFPRMLKNERLFGYKTSEYIKDIGTFDRLERAEKDLSSGKIGRFSKKNKRPAVFLDRDGTLIKDVNFLCKAEDIELLPSTVPALSRLNGSDYLSVVVTNQSAIARNLCSLDTLKYIHDTFETMLGEKRVYVDGIYFCPHHPDKGFPGENPLFKIECECRKPKIGMITRAAKEHNIDLKASWLIGDKTTDIQTAVNAGLKSILLKCGDISKDEQSSVQPDFVCENLEKAVDIVIGDGIYDQNNSKSIY